MNRDETIRLAQMVRTSAIALPEGCRVVVVVTGPEGEFVGVSSSTYHGDTEAILRCALAQEERVNHPRGAVIDVEGYEEVRGDSDINAPVMARRLGRWPAR